jgi:hypothetical protein
MSAEAAMAMHGLARLPVAPNLFSIVSSPFIPQASNGKHDAETKGGCGLRTPSKLCIQAGNVDLIEINCEIIKMRSASNFFANRT